ncbi:MULTISPECIES: Hsp20/alpha crystallin family protein [Rhodococcus]|uniref:Hsp20/alpha crystallin family protein n=1 Tax=Rhodococcus oxybenzonivorans TaxID=1990687 RepID=A0AAE4V4M8_9NOCA|nr:MULTISPECIES: Hsp20/alpha crystallin family protein [Rhodococcus]MDV7243162.1 Hsp20/alpha crystallin family protein [Rhodococcus oxybenzonivorans]MDV7268352.1 Hsp20/alpha crystallin family protein [Rhodococcus oxybenzonivorans]MDV7278090.1 Hsp20/alpha crystallin family protein [Rhodococcus oxybenzonivorans]MDV7334579.1 Hsp20/alpha crystallin family protein [Rhodococcus oxybenzonivorans]MDV7344733.1 Hsp20/alpha crystallin family protein [Rhodococcus oxybenzonivorans]
MASPIRRHADVAQSGPFRIWDSWTPAVTVEETADSYVVEAVVPGVPRENIDVNLSGNELSIEGEITERKRVGLIRHQTRRTGQFRYRATLPREVDGDKVAASLEDGVLRVEIGKAEPERARRIEITSG